MGPATANPAGAQLTVAEVEEDFSTRKFSRTKVSISLLQKVLKALAGVLTIGSPFRLKDVFSTTGTPVAWPKRSIRR